MRSFYVSSRLLLLAIAGRAAANFVVNSYTMRGAPPPDRVPCMDNSDCQASGGCSSAVGRSCNNDLAEDLQPDGQYSCMEETVPGTEGTSEDACDDPQANGFVDCWDDSAQSNRGPDELLKRYCSPRNVPGGMYFTGYGTLVVNPYTSQGEPPPDAIPCTDEDDDNPICTDNPISSACHQPDDVDTGESPHCWEDGCVENITPGTEGTSSDACDDPQGNGFIKCEPSMFGQVLQRYCSPRNAPGGMYVEGTPPPVPPSPPPTPPFPPAPREPLPDFTNTLEGQLTFAGSAALFMAINALVAYLVHVRNKFDALELKQTAKAVAAERKGCSGKMRKGAFTAGSFFVKWVCIESALEIVVEMLNYLATVNTEQGSAVSYYIAFALNVLMIVLERIEVRRTRQHGGKQTPWDRFWFGQWQDSTRKNFYTKYSARMMIGFQLFVNISALPSVIMLSSQLEQQSDESCDGNEPGSGLSCGDKLYNQQYFNAMMLGGLNEMKFTMGLFTLAETVGVTLLEPLLATLPKRLQRLRVGPLASPEQYSARDFAITNVACAWFGVLFYNLNYKFIGVCGWSPDKDPWNLPGYPNEEQTCDDYGRTFPQEVFAGEHGDDGNGPMLAAFIGMIIFLVAVPCIVLWLVRKFKLPSWGAPSPPASDAEAQEGVVKV